MTPSPTPRAQEQKEKALDARMDSQRTSDTSRTAPANGAAQTFPDDAEPIDVLRAVAACARGWDGLARLLGNVRAQDIVRAIAAVEALIVAGDEVIERAESEGWACYRGTDASRLEQLAYALDNVAPEPSPAVVEQTCRHCGEDIRQDAVGDWMDRETHLTCLQPHRRRVKHEPLPDLLSSAPSVGNTTKSDQEKDQDSRGDSQRHGVSDGG